MTRDDYKKLISFEPLRKMLFITSAVLPYVAKAAGLNAVTIQNILDGKALPTINTIFKLASTLNVRMSDIVEFKGLDMKSPYEQRIPKNTRFTYQPLREYVQDLGMGFTDFVLNVPGIEVSEERKSHWYKGTGKERLGLTLDTEVAHNIITDGNLSMRVIYSICKVYHLTWDKVIGVIYIEESCKKTRQEVKITERQKRRQVINNVRYFND